MRLISIFFIIVILLPSKLVASSCDDRGIDAGIARNVLLLSELSAPTGDEILNEVLSLTSPEAPQFCILYEIGRYYTRSGNYPLARDYLQRAIQEEAAEDKKTYAVLNVIGFTFLREGNVDAALDFFQKQRSDTNFSSLPTIQRTKVFNNLGYTLMQLGRFDEAETNLLEAKKLGSNLAERNLQALRSLRATVASDSNDIPGVFAAVVGSSKSKLGAEKAILPLASRLGVPPTDLFVFEMDNGRYSLTFGSYESYPKALESVDLARSKGINDAYVSSLTKWNEIAIERAQ